MKTKNILLISALLVLLATACKKEGGFDHRSQWITESLEGKTFTVLKITGAGRIIDLKEASRYKGSRIMMSFNDDNTSLDFIPGDTSFKFGYWDKPWLGICRIADYQHFFMGYSADHNLVIKTSVLNPPEMLITQTVSTGIGVETFPMIDLDGKYEVVKSYPNGDPGFILNKYEHYTNQGNGYGQILVSIELIKR